METTAYGWPVLMNAWLQNVLGVLAVLTLAGFVMQILDAMRGMRTLVRLKSVTPVGLAEAPPVSLIIPACNEETKIGIAMESLLAQTYPRLQVIAVNDRSTDATGTILHRMALGQPMLQVVDVTELPAGWLGKNHALQVGALAARGEWLLFADADVVMEPTAIARAIAYAGENRLDQLAVTPRAIVGGFLAKSFLSLFGVLFGLYAKPWRVRDPKSKSFIGIGAFNLVRASAWRAVGGFVPIALRPDDDMKLGKLLKSRGFRCDLAIGVDLLSVEWYDSFAAMRDGFLKNMFSVFHYNAALAVLAALGQFLTLVWPFIAVIALRGPLQWLNAAIVGVLFLFTVGSCIESKIGWWWAFTVPVAGTVHLYLLAHSVIVNLREGGIRWRGTKYPLELLRTNRF